jgi:sugar/nucleoside kinase (ribokinase family)
MAESRTRVVVFGDVMDDIVAVPDGPIRVDTDTPSSIVRRAGGSAANAATWLAAAGANVEFIGRVAAADVERHGRLLSDAGVTPRLIADPELPTGAIVVIVDGDRRTMLTQKGANAALVPDDITDELLAGARLLHFTGYSLFGRDDATGIPRLIARATALGVEVSVDPGSAGFLEDYGIREFLAAIAGSTFLFPNLDEGMALTGLSDPLAIVEDLGTRFPVVALTLGVDGVVIAQRGVAPVTVPAAETLTNDPTGAGDAFCGAFLEAWIGGADAADAARAGVLFAARAVAVVGGRPGA